MLSSRLIVTSMVLAASGCAFDAPSFDGTTYQCEPVTERCPAGFRCELGVCVAGAPDTDAEPGDGGGGDAGPGDDGPRPTRYTFGERPDADHTGVTTDTTLDSDLPLPPRGAEEFLEIDAGPIRSTLLRFDISAIPTDAVVTAASLEVSVFDPLENGTFQLYRVAEAWQEASATWDERVVGLPWAGPGATGASRLPTLVAETAPRMAPVTISITLAPAAVQAWVASPATNYGVVWISTSADGRGGQLRSSEYATVTERPRLTVNVAP